MANVTTWEFIVGFLYILGGLGIFLFGMRVMSEGIQKVAGDGMRRIMATMTQNRFFGLGTGLLVTCLVQSSSATTVMVVSFVNAQLLTLMESIGVIMGATLGPPLPVGLLQQSESLVYRKLLCRLLVSDYRLYL